MTVIQPIIATRAVLTVTIPVAVPLASSVAWWVDYSGTGDPAFGGPATFVTIASRPSLG